MSGRLKIPIRIKILIAVLFVVSSVVGVITFTMANLFHSDKKTYINDMTSVMALSTAGETRYLLAGYAERLRDQARIIGSDEIGRQRQIDLVKGLFDDFEGLVAITLYEDGEEIAAAYDSAKLEAAGIGKDQIVADRSNRPLPLETIEGGKVFLENSTLSETLPTMTLAVAGSAHKGDEPLIVSAVLELRRLQQLTARSGVFDVYLVGPDDVLLAHPAAQRVAAREKVPLAANVRQTVTSHGAGMTTEIVLDGREMIAGYAGAEIGGVVAVAQIPKTAAYLASRSLLNRLLLVAFILLMVAAIASLIWAHRITRPVERLAGATRDIAKGNFEIQVEVNARDEIGGLASSFNQMATELHNREGALREAHAQLVQSEKMAAFGQLGAGIAHEVKNPLAGILGCAQLAMRKIEDGTPLAKNLRLIEKETKRCKIIIDNLLKFARQEKMRFDAVDVNAVIHDSVAIVNHQLELNNVKIALELDPELPLIHGNANQLQQVLMNLMVNAQHAMEGSPGTVTVATGRSGEEAIEIRVSDTGPGIPYDIREKLFEPFFTTKPTGKGTGLGLSVSFGIIRDHGGEIRAGGEPGHGAIFVITLPVRNETAQSETATEGMRQAI